MEPTPKRRTLLSAGVDAGRQNKVAPATGEVSLDLPLHGKKHKRDSMSTPFRDVGVCAK